MSVMWSVVTALFALALWAMRSTAARSGIVPSAGQWLAYLVWLVWTLWGVAVVWTFLDEGEPRAARVATATLGGSSVLGAIALALLWRLP